jgi:hypothetical protein
LDLWFAHRTPLLPSTQRICHQRDGVPAFVNLANYSNYGLLATIHNEKATAVAISIVQAACEHPHRISASPATVTGPNSATLDSG